MRWLLVSVALVAFILTAPAQAETWSCSYHDKGKGHPMPFSFVRNGGTFDVPVLQTAFQVVYESREVIHLHKAYNKLVHAYSVSLFKSIVGARFAMARTNNTQLEPTVESWVGSCIIN